MQRRAPKCILELLSIFLRGGGRAGGKEEPDAEGRRDRNPFVLFEDCRADSSRIGIYEGSKRAF